ncbi:hypothetical protein ACFSUS_06000 [Spirosoma soli]|uniref:Uncharacterized protein n=1 Tax=Spirosoma soli TaxID=1770529 RepID=A0ABW5M227_9BACT
MHALKVNPSVTRNYNQAGKANWEVEAERLHRNFHVISAILNQSAGLPCETVKRYQTLQDTILDTMDNLLTELEHADRANKLNQCESFNQFLKQHALVMKTLNTRVDNLITEITA